MTSKINGRPTTYTDEMLLKAWEYIDSGWKDGEGSIPSVVGLCSYIERSRSIVYDWAADESKSFSDILEAIAEKQELELVNKGLSSEFNSTITKLMLTKHGYSDRVESAHNVTSMSHEDWLDSLDD